jgi:hypothetical protein
LNDLCVAWSGLLTAAARWQADAVDLAAGQSGQSAPSESISRSTVLRSWVSRWSAASRLTSAASADR